MDRSACGAGLRMGLTLNDCGEEDCFPAQSWGPADVDCYLLRVIMRGRGEYRPRDETYFLQAGQAFLIYPGVTAFYSADEKDPWSCVWIGYSGADAEACTELAGIERERPVLELGGLLEQVAQAIRTVRADATGLERGDIAAAGGMYRLFALLSQEGRGGDSLDRNAYLKRAMWYMQANLQRGVGVEEVAGYVGLSRSQLFRVFKESVGTSPQQALMEMKLRGAESLLTDTDLSMSEVALSAGFSSVGRMGEAFRVHRGMTPTQARRNGREGNRRTEK